MKRIFFTIGAIIFFTIAYYLISPAFKMIELNEELPSVQKTVEDFTVLSEANFQPKDHEVSGKALIIETNNQRILRFEDFETINGPDLHIYLSSDLEAKDYVDLGEIKATKGNVNYEVPNNVDLEKYNKVLVWGQPFRVLFSYAELE